MSMHELNRAIHHIYTTRSQTMAFRSEDYSILDRFGLSSDERRALEARDFPRLWALNVHPVLLFHFSAVLYPRDWYLQEVVPRIKGIPNHWYDYYADADLGTKNA